MARHPDHEGCTSPSAYLVIDTEPRRIGMILRTHAMQMHRPPCAQLSVTLACTSRSEMRSRPATSITHAVVAHYDLDRVAMALGAHADRF